MTQTAETMLDALLELPEADRVAIANRLIDSVDSVELEPDAAAWEAFLEERLAAADRGDFSPGTPFDVIEEIRREIRQEAK